MRLQPVGVITNLGAVDRIDWDAVLLCVPSDALRRRWVHQLAARLGRAPVVSIGQSLGDRELLAKVLPEGETLFLVPALFAWSGPLAGEVPTEAVAYWLPPGAKQVVSGKQPDQVASLVAALRAGGMRARSVADAAAEGARMAARIMPYVVALEATGWSFPALRRDPLLAVAARAAIEAEAALDSHDGRGNPSKARRPETAAARLALVLLPRLAPFDIEAYARKHFTKVRGQTTLMLEEWSALAREHGLASEALGALARATGRG